VAVGESVCQQLPGWTRCRQSPLASGRLLSSSRVRGRPNRLQGNLLVMCRIGINAPFRLGASRALQQNHSRPTRRLAPRLLPVGIPPVISRSPLGKSSATPSCMSPSESRFRVAHPAAGDLVTDRPVLTFGLSPCLTTAGLTTAGSAGSRRRSPTIGRRVPFRPMSSADRRSMAAVRLRGVVRHSMRPPDRILVRNRRSDKARRGGRTRPWRCSGLGTSIRPPCRAA
jgi:hypothetical protein